jgi:hypothetical protein
VVETPATETATVPVEPAAADAVAESAEDTAVAA